MWLLWHSVIGLVLMRRSKEWEAPVMSVLSLVQVFLSMMLLGIYFGNIHIGSNPFELMRLKESNLGLPWTKIPDYLSKIALFRDGRGLNPLLQNYWMTIHPPTLFLGFALTTVPLRQYMPMLMQVSAIRNTFLSTNLQWQMQMEL